MEFGFAKITHHEGAVICTYETTLSGSLEQTREKLLPVLERIRCFAQESGGIIGHIKATARETGRSLSLSTTGEEVHTLNSTALGTEVALTAILFCVDERALQSLVERLFEELE